MSRLFTIIAAAAIATSLCSTAQAWPHRQRLVVRQQVVVQKVVAQPVVQAVYAQPLVVAQPVVAAYSAPVVQQVVKPSCYGSAQLVAPVVGGRGSACFFGR